MQWSQVEPFLIAFLLAYLKTSVFVFLLPFGSGLQSAARKAAISCALALMYVSPQPDSLLGTQSLLTNAAEQILLGLRAGLPMALAAGSVRLWADWLELLRGEQLATLLEPGNQRAQSLLGSFAAQYFTCALLLSGVLGESLLLLDSALPVNSPGFAREAGAALVNVAFSALAFASSLHVGLALTFFALELGQAALSKLLPQVLGFQELFIAKWIISLLVLAGVGAELVPRFLRLSLDLQRGLGGA